MRGEIRSYSLLGVKALKCITHYSKFILCARLLDPKDWKNSVIPTVVEYHYYQLENRSVWFMLGNRVFSKTNKVQEKLFFFQIKLLITHALKCLL